MEIIIHRVLWSALFGALLLMVWKHPGWWRELVENPRRLAILALSGTLIAANWLTLRLVGGACSKPASVTTSTRS